MANKENRWTVDEVRCLDCGRTFGLSGANVSRDVGRPMGDGARILMVTLPETCPACHNLKEAGASDGG
jgi:hypothetical protein